MHWSEWNALNCVGGRCERSGELFCSTCYSSSHYWSYARIKHCQPIQSKAPLNATDRRVSVGIQWISKCFVGLSITGGMPSESRLLRSQCWLYCLRPSPVAVVLLRPYISGDRSTAWAPTPTRIGTELKLSKQCLNGWQDESNLMKWWFMAIEGVRRRPPKNECQDYSNIWRHLCRVWVVVPLIAGISHRSTHYYYWPPLATIGITSASKNILIHNPDLTASHWCGNWAQKGFHCWLGIVVQNCSKLFKACNRFLEKSLQ